MAYRMLFQYLQIPAIFLNKLNEIIGQLEDEAAEKGPIVDSGLTMNTARLAGRTTAGVGAVEEISVGTGLTLAAGVLSNSSNVVAANPTATIGTAAVNGVASTYMRSDAAPQFGNLTGPITSLGMATAVASQTGTGSTFVMKASPALTTPDIGAATGTSLALTGQLTSTLATGTAPFVVASTTLVANLNAAALGGATFAAPGTIGGGTPGIGNFTTLNASSVVSTGAVSGTTGTFTGLLQGLGTNTNNNASAGQIGEVISSVVLTGSAVAITSAATVNITSISLTAGDWEVSGEGWIQFAGSPSAVSVLGAGITTTSATMPTVPAVNTARNVVNNASLSALLQILPLSTTRMSLSGTTTVYLVGTTTFSGGSSSGYGVIRARRAR